MPRPTYAEARTMDSSDLLAILVSEQTPDGSALSAPAAAPPETSTLRVGGIDVPVKRAFANVAAATTDGPLVAAVPTKKIRVLALYAKAGGVATDLTLTSKPAGAGTAISAKLANAANDGAVLGFASAGWCETAAGEGLSVTTGVGSATGIGVVYVEV